ncbi:MAG: hypothetical protein WAQ28_05430 [Bacteroidia bacterium]
MRLLIIVLVHCIVIFSVYGTTLNLSVNPEKQILGVWQEVDWEYEKVDLNTPNKKQIASRVREEVAKNNVLHTSEIWEFLPNRKLKIHFMEKNDLMADWKLKGRGHILKLENENKTEYYEISELTNDILVLHLNIDIEARGIAKLTFKKVGNAKEI